MSTTSSSGYRIPFGKHSGELLSDLDDGYVRWLATRDNLRPNLRRHVDEECARRGLDVEHPTGPRPLVARPPQPQPAAIPRHDPPTCGACGVRGTPARPLVLRHIDCGETDVP